MAQVLNCTMDYFFEGLPSSKGKIASSVAKSDGAVVKLSGTAEGLALCRAFVGIKTPAQRKAAIAFLRNGGRQLRPHTARALKNRTPGVGRGF